MMWQKIKCWLIGHNWKQQGIATVKHLYENFDGKICELGYKDHLFFKCSRCHKLWEHKCQTTYDYIDMHKKPENFNISEKHAQESNI